MPLIKSKSKKARGANIAELIRTYKRKGKIGKTKPRSMKHAQKIAAAIAYSMGRR